MSHLVLIDGHHLMYRAYWAIPRTLKTSKGEQVNTVFGMASMLLAILKTEEPDSLLFCFDEGEETFRHQENETYKDGRAETPDDFYVQIPRVMEFIDAFGLRRASDPGFEADDLICAYALQARDAGDRVTIVSGDKDLYQLVDDNIRIAIPHKGYAQAEYLGPQEVEAKLGVRPDQVVDYKGLCGDSSDNLPGVMGIGPKGAEKLLQEYQTLEGIYENLGDLAPKMREKLERDQEQAFFCKRMAQLVSDSMPVPAEELALSNLPVGQIEAAFASLEFTLLRKRLQTILATEYGKRVFDVSVVMQDIEDVFGGSEADESERQLAMF